LAGSCYNYAMINEIRVSAPAKINLHLAVGSSRPDGFHAIASLFQAISLADSVSISLDSSAIIHLDAACDCPVQKNTAYRAASAFLAAASSGGLGRVPGVRITIDKKIPMGAGLGGGSSDAASTLKGLAALLPGFVDDSTLFSLAASIGSDVPFFLGSACAAVAGRGELLSPVAARDDYALLLVDPGFSISTKDAYARLDEYRSAGGGAKCRPHDELEAELAGFASSYRREEPSSWGFRNDFYDALGSSMPTLKACREAILGQGAVFASMSGSGSAMYGVFASAAEAYRAALGLHGTMDSGVYFPLACLPDSI
jgi:4-diphosphocytidyl-2-C-methyl-D-erythritol kinase